MASCNGLSRSFLPSSLKTRPGFAKIENMEPVRVVISLYGTRKQKWNINVPQTSAPSRLHPDTFAVEYEEKIEEIRQVLRSKGEDDPSESLVLVDAIQRVGLGSCYEEEIETLLQKHFMASYASIHGYYSLRDVSLFFRLFRQHGHYVSPDVFNNFKGEDGRFRRNLSQDVRGLMELYEAAQLSFQGEYILDEAASFSSQLLHQYCLADVDDNLSRIVIGKLRYPYHKTIPRLTRKDFLQHFEAINGWGKTLKELAVMDLRKGQSVYQGELTQVSKWWNELGLEKKLKLVRNQIPKWYTWSMSILIDDFSLSLQRVELTKSVAFIYLIDDIFDVVGTLDELTIFTEAWASLCNAYLVEAKWFASGVSPTADMHLENGKVSTGVHVVLVHLFFLLGLGRTSGGTINLPDVSELISGVATILRLWNDLGGAKDGNEDGTDGSYIDFYMKDHPGISTTQARDHVIIQ
ncbi:Tricyclene synthase Oc15, chloroplastic [Sesamum alatum]|uniref:Tricyclene synthase Oc15, chloroplastic n=1 Tax=Sesamum alatum TaxID=300844 RepID=A0AAE2CYL5_9LAMI|nr:Tricyclene synthase Oc15, chloroplastic [Sesamum alatum]